MKNKIKLFLTFISLSFLGLVSYAQTEGVSIKSTVSPPHPSSMLDVESASKGILIPRVNLSSLIDIVNVPNPADGLMVFNKGAFIEKGFYYYDVAQLKWVKLGAKGIPQITYSQMLGMTPNLDTLDRGMFVFITNRHRVFNIRTFRYGAPQGYNCNNAIVHGLWFLSSTVDCENNLSLMWQKVNFNEGDFLFYGSPNCSDLSYDSPCWHNNIYIDEYSGDPNNPAPHVKPRPR